MTKFLTRVQVEGAASIIRNRSRYQPTIGIVLGSGLNDIAQSVQFPDIIPTNQIPHWPASTVPGHVGRLLLGRLEDKVVLVLQGRSHFYEGYAMDQITLPVRVMSILGIKTLIVTNAAGGMNSDYKAGDLMLIKDHINIPGMAGNNPLRGPNDNTFGPRFPDMTEPYDRELRAVARKAAAEAEFDVQEGVYAYVAGPSYETPAELRYLKMIGGDAVGMSTVPSVLVARHAGMR
ncbi:MAG: purine-nucleoside phosphorylase, partial [Anaerolineales bacterium]|nr:purine-nucleoside phosphorylase [Anaerolineales bacterium]